ncbi:MAG: hypothetical protein JXJ04_12550 [Spirochaetales bacterium]|nr:hypothetical protein [Spirochaetales bacterium]
MRKTHTEKTDTFKAYDQDEREYLVHEFTLFNDIQVPEEPAQKVVLTRSYKTETGEHVKKQDSNNFLILTEYGKKNVEIQKFNK